jgi:3-dehydroquinate synthase
MQESFNIKSSSGEYSVKVGDSILESILELQYDNLFIIDKNLKSYIPESLEKIIYIDANEENKSLEKIPHYINEMKRFNINRKSHIFAIGGGVIQDISTFSSSIYMRGIKWSYFPTTVLGMVDSCVGGKSAINLGERKNLVGNFFPPENIFIDTKFIKTLSIDHTIGGIFEAAKICYARGQDEFSKFINIMNDLSVSDSKEINKKIDFNSMILLSLKSKKWFIETDEFDQKERLLLNFGHTFGHAFESATEYKVSHGISVGFGMAVAIEVSKQLKLLNDSGKDFSNKLTSFLDDSFNTMQDLNDIKIKDFDYNSYIEAFKNDKKHFDTNYRVILPVNNGSLKIIEIDKSFEVEELITKVSKKYINKYNFIK